ncbi:protein SMAX1-LIKE 3-like [Punica granatum]|uniref:Clp R domain-containing protein n=2 Tax=Punica granatum TaxID=22663 RepID=A0A218XCA6_PUNGR|nr:protein SMAX1-LIKE 3-like [Punica granatum]OWM82573.1 hypothetical protein CDL15_Pgr002148 [Punica granatum]PKI48252.1 hypothetical protein CRG98_031354 [Punica granatum]
MRAGGSCTLQQALTPEAAALIKQSVTLAKRRGHVQVSPLHVAATMLTASTGLLRAACLRSHSHPLQCKALELCFNVALNRLPAAASGPMFGIHGAGNSHHHHVPSISNALIAAFKRAQAHQRRGSIESNQSLLAVKIEMDQLVISILDDPSVSRVMREAGFSSSQVKNNVERAVLLEKSPSSPASSVHDTTDTGSMDANINSSQSNTPCLPPSSENGSKQDHSSMPSRVTEEDVIHVMKSLREKRRKSIVIVGECTDTIEGVIRGLTDTIRNESSSNDVARSFKGVKFVNLSLPSFEHLSREVVEQKLGDLRAHLRSYQMLMGDDNINNGVVLFLGDLRWVAENRANAVVEHLVTEFGKLIFGVGEDEKVWVMGMATLQSYMRCKRGYPSLESVWRLHPVAVPVGSLSFSLIADSDVESGCASMKTGETGASSSGWLQPLGVGNQQLNEHLSCCVHCYSEFEKEARSLRNSSANGNGNSTSSASSLPPWLQQYKDEKNVSVSRNDDDRDYARDLWRKWNSICSSIHGQLQSSERFPKFSSLPPSPSSSGFPYEPSNPNQIRAGHAAWDIDQSGNVNLEPHLSRHSSLPNSGSSSDDVMEIEYLQRFKELNAKNMKLLISELEDKIPWQKDVIPEIATTILRCRSGMIKRKGNVKEDGSQGKNETWFLFQGADREGKEKAARELSRLIFGSYDSLVSISLGRQSRDEKSCNGFGEFAEAVSDNPHRVFAIEDIAESDRNCRACFKKAMERGKLDKSLGYEVDLKDAIIILSSSGSLMSRLREGSPTKPSSGDEEQETNPSLSLDLNISITHGSSGNDHGHANDIEFTECVDKLVVFEIQEL